MPHDIEAYEGGRAQEEAGRTDRLGAQCPQALVGKVHRVVLVGSSFSDPGDDWTRWDCFDQDGVKVHSRTVPGY